MDFKGRHIWIIGASEGIGRALALELGKRGAKLILSARSTDKLEALNAQLDDNHTVLPLDVTDVHSVQQAIGKIQNLDGLIYMAGEYRPGPICEMTANDLSQMMLVNFTAPADIVRTLLPHMRASGGLIALCASVAGYRGLPNGQPYSACKAALINFTETLRAEEARNGIDVRLICPGFVRTRMTEKNNFRMPMMIEPAEAARAIADGLQGTAFEIHFPKIFTCFMKLLRILPDGLYFALARRL
ncbi:MAG: SDR family NAD(P)-dependent oxidoreductase [Proteobacteria bacterium]|nr:SDR family NAD(P)-dependent oxidoreductase [Pseudomonadota bacterium]